MEAIVYRKLHLEKSVKIVAKLNLIEKVDIHFRYLQLYLWE